MNQRNYQREMETILIGRALQPPQKLLLHSCCGPCSTSVLEILGDIFEVILFFYNPNILSKEEYRLRLDAQKIVLRSIKTKYKITLLEGEYSPETFLDLSAGMEHLPEGSERCSRCFQLRLTAAAEMAEKHGCTWFCTTLTVSPHKDANKINAIGEEIARGLPVSFLPADFKKRGGYQRSIELSKEFELYRQNFCGCVYSLPKKP